VLADGRNAVAVEVNGGLVAHLLANAGLDCSQRRLVWRRWHEVAMLVCVVRRVLAARFLSRCRGIVALGMAAVR
jgi:hypothetical protein